MLHEILLSLSGHPSALFNAHGNPKDVKPDSFALLSPPEAELLSSISHLSNLHRRTRHHAAKISSSHKSTICRAVATAITSHHLEKFQRKVLEVESRILKQDATTVGAYNIVPLAGIVGEFAEWTKLMEWLWNIANFMHMVEGDAPTDWKLAPSMASGSEIIDKLRLEAQTGYPDIESAALHLGKVAETAWLRHLSSWILYGRMPSFGAGDFLINPGPDANFEYTYLIDHSMLPKFVTRETAHSIWFIGISLKQIRSLDKPTTSWIDRSFKTSELELLPEHVRYLSEVTAPISPAKLSEAVANIRLSLSRNLLQHLLPLEKILDVLAVLHQFFLVGRGEFAMALIAEADEKLHSRHRNPARSKPGQAIQGVLPKEGEISNTLTRSLRILASRSSEEDRTDDTLDLATDILRLTIHNPSTTRPGTPGRARESSSALPKITNVVFNDLLLSVPTSLAMDIRSPLDLFITNSDVEIYSAINAYLFAVRRAHLHLAQLWRHSWIRRHHPPPPGYQFSNTPYGKETLQKRRQRYEARAREMRKVWATCAAAIFLLSESEAYFQGEVVQESWKHFRDWVVGGEAHSTEQSHDSSTSVIDEFRKSTSHKRQHHDPETLAFAHRKFLSSLSYSLLLTDLSFTKLIREFFTHVDELVAFITRLQIIRQNLDLDEDDGVEDSLTNYKAEEKEVSRELDRARRRLDGDMKSLMSRLRDIDTERVGSRAMGGIVGERSASVREEGDYEPLRVGGVDRLLMKLDWGDGDEAEESD